MRKVICDFCNKPTDDSYEYTLPMSVPIEAKNKDGVVLARVGHETQDVTRDVCPKCRKKSLHYCR